MNYSLCLTLGHNASAILIHEGYIINGYDNEKITGIKADSQFPIQAIQELGKYHDISKVMDIYVSHWSTFGDVDEMSRKHWRRDLLSINCPDAKIHSLVMGELTHHDAHVEALRAFTSPKQFAWEIVADGFGNMNEVLSIYHDQVLMHRVFGYEKSLGLLYQYTTAYLGLKMNQDEFKLLGYESHIFKVCDSYTVNKLINLADKYAKQYSESILNPSIEPRYDAIAGLHALPETRLKIRNKNEYILFNRLGYKKSTIDEFDRKVIIAFFVQSVVESVMERIIFHFGIRDVALTGGLFMNVKLNNHISKQVNSICVLPLCGDVSCGLGVYKYYKSDLVWPKDLFWSKRDFSDFPINEPGTFITNSITAALDQVNTQLKADKIVNFIYGNGEMGARALGHTTTFARPTDKNVEYINRLNKRNTVMPCAGMVCENYIDAYLYHNKVYKSLEYMIMTLDLSSVPTPNINGCHHKHPLNFVWTNRVQLIGKDHFLYDLLKIHRLLINTSFNRHGVPIVLTTDQIIDTHRFQRERDTEGRMITIVCKGD